MNEGMDMNICKWRIAGMVLIGVMLLSLVALNAVAATAYWEAPNKRENGVTINKLEIKGYEIQYWEVGPYDSVVAGSKKSIVVLGGGSYRAEVPLVVGKNYQVQIATVDTDGLYSKWAIFPLSNVVNNYSSSAGSVAGVSSSIPSSSAASSKSTSASPLPPIQTKNIIQCYPRPVQ